MGTTSNEPIGRVIAQPVALPPRREVLTAMLVGTGRGGVPLRSDFIQLKEPGSDGTRHSSLAAFTTDPRALDAYLLIHALASSKAPYEASYPASVWAHAVGLTRDATDLSARQRWSKAIAKLTKQGLISAGKDGRQAVYTLLHESGNGEPYTRPTKLSEGGWEALPYAYWLEGFDEELSLPEKLMLLVSLDQKSRFELPAARVPEWYGISEMTARRGLERLADRGILTVDTHTQIDLQNPKSMIRTVNTYATVGMWERKSRTKAMTVRRRKIRLVANEV